MFLLLDFMEEDQQTHFLQRVLDLLPKFSQNDTKIVAKTEMCTPNNNKNKLLSYLIANALKLYTPEK
jgi:hypothetical protein